MTEKCVFTNMHVLDGLNEKRIENANVLPEEPKAIGYEAEKWGTYAFGHSFSDRGSRIAIDAGVQCIEHGYGPTDETLRLMKERNVFLSIQFEAYTLGVPDSAAIGVSADSVFAQKYVAAIKDFDAMYRRAIAVGVKMTFSTDLFGWMEMQARQSLEFTKRAKYFTPYQILVQATSTGAELLGRSGKLNPYQDGALGVIKEGAYADILVVNGNPLEDFAMFSDPAKNRKLIMKDGKIYENTIN